MCVRDSFYTADPEVRSGVGRVLKEVPGHFVLQGHLCSVWQNGQYKRTREIQEVKEGFADLMERLDVPSLDVGMIHYVDSMEDWKAVLDGPVGAFARELKQSGRIHHIGPVSYTHLSDYGGLRDSDRNGNRPNGNCSDFWL